MSATSLREAIMKPTRSTRTSTESLVMLIRRLTELLVPETLSSIMYAQSRVKASMTHMKTLRSSLRTSVPSNNTCSTPFRSSLPIPSSPRSFLTLLTRSRTLSLRAPSAYLLALPPSKVDLALKEARTPRDDRSLFAFS